MKQLIVAGMTSLLAFGASASFADTQTDAGTPAITEEESKREAYLDKTKCKVQRTVGSRIQAKKKCLTNREWELLAERSKKWLDHKNNKALGIQGK